MKIENVVIGQNVKYNQGRAKGLKAVVTAVDAQTGKVNLKAIGNGREFARLAKLISR
jgi:hypothetical protein